MFVGEKGGGSAQAGGGGFDDQRAGFPSVSGCEFHLQCAGLEDAFLAEVEIQGGGNERRMAAGFRGRNLGLPCGGGEGAGAERKKQEQGSHEGCATCGLAL